MFLRGGYALNQAAAPDETVTPLLPEARRNHLTAGWGLGSGRRSRSIWRTSSSLTRIDAGELSILRPEGAYRLEQRRFIAPEAICWESRSRIGR